MNVQLLEYRGHIRNWRALCEQLSVNEDMPREERERVLILKGYETWGTDLGSHLIGMYAFALKDQEKIVAIRDRFGTKPFYYFIM